MSVSFKDFYVLVDAVEDTLDEGKIWDAIKKKLGGDKASDVDVAAEVERVKGIDASDLDKIKKTKASHEFKMRQAARAADQKKQDTASTFDNPKSSLAARTGELKNRLDSKSVSAMRGGERRSVDRQWMQEEVELTEGQCDFKVTYSDVSGKTKNTILRGRDVREIRRKFGDQYYRMKLLSVEPVKAKPQKVQPKTEEDDE